LNNLFAAIYLDEDVDILVAELLRGHGFIAITAREAGQLGKKDPEQLAYAASQMLTLVSHNLPDFAALARQYYQTGQTHGGIILAARHSPHEIARRLLGLLNQITADEMQNTLRYI
jgi:predicted nuclease of predicted toxin-antitoxin system